MKHVAMFLFPGYGHVTPTLELTRCLVDRGHRVSYLVDDEQAGPVAAVGAQVVRYRSRRGRLGAQPATGEDIGALGLAFLRDSIEVILPAARTALRDDVPDLLLYDLESFLTARSLARQWDRPTVQLFAYVATNEHFSLALEVFQGAPHNVQECIALVAGHLTANGMPPESVWPFLTNYDEHNIALLPREFQPCGETFDDRYTFVGHSFDEDRAVARPGGWAPPGPEPVVLISLGTEVNDRPGFFQTCAEAFAGSGWRVVMTVGRGNRPDRSPGEHVQVHEWLPYREVLPHATAVVCHGGMGSVLESLYHEVPLIIVPHTPEQALNARRTEELGLGRTLPEEQFTPQRLRAEVSRLTADPGLGGRLAAMATAMRKAGGPSRAADVVEQLLTARATTI